MLDLPHQSYVAWQTCVTVFHAVAILSAVLRIATRYKSRRMWLDDYLVVIPMAADFVYCISPWALPLLTPDPRTTNSGLETYWATLLLVFIIIWISRICFMLSLARIFPPGSPNRSLIVSLVFMFALLFCSAVLLLAFHCDPSNSESDRHCVKFLPVGPGTMYTFSVDALSDVIMIVIPLAVLWRVKLPTLEKRVIFAALSGSIVTLLLFGILMFLTFGPFHSQSLSYCIVGQMLTHLVAATSLLSCNALVVVTNIYRIYRRRVVRMEGARGPQTISGDAPSPTGPATSSAPAFDFEKSTEAANRRASGPPYDPGLDSTSDGTTGRKGSASVYALTQITMDDDDSWYGPPSSTTYPQSHLPSELADRTTCVSGPGIH